jgi:hypothetical protein
MKKNINILFAIIGMLALAGCESPLSVAKNQVSSARGAVTVTIETPQTANGARTIYPTNLEDGFTRYELTFSSDSASHEPEEVTEGSANVTLLEGNWTITATAYSSGEDNDEIASALGSAPVEISSDETDPVSIIITLGPVPAGVDGTLSYSVTIPADAEGSLTVKTVTGGDVENGTTQLDAETNEDTLDLPSGEYLLFVSLTKDGNQAGRTEVLHIYPGLTSEASYTFVDNDFVTKTTLTAGPIVNVFASASTADVTFTGANGFTTFTLSNADFAVDNNAVVAGISVTSDTATVTITFEENDSTSDTKTYIVSIAESSTRIKGDTTVVITQATVKLLTWEAVVDSTFDPDGAVKAITYANGIFVAGGDGEAGGAVAYSEDGITWTPSSSTFNRSITAIAYGNDKFLAAGYTGSFGSAAYSEDGITWTPLSSVPVSSPTAIAYGNGKFLMGGHTGVLKSSEDGITWTSVTLTGGYFPAINVIIYGGGRFFMGMASSTTMPYPLYSEDGINWTMFRNEVFNNMAINGIVPYDNGNKYILVGENGHMGLFEIGQSQDDAIRIASPFQDPDTYTYTHINAITYGGGKFVAVGDDGKMAYSTDDINWTLVTDSPFEDPDTYTHINAITYGGGRFVAVGDDGKIAYSSLQE